MLSSPISMVMRTDLLQPILAPLSPVEHTLPSISKFNLCNCVAVSNPPPGFEPQINCIQCSKTDHKISANNFIDEHIEDCSLKQILPPYNSLNNSQKTSNLLSSFSSPKLPYYKYTRYNHFFDRKRRPYRKSAYMLAIVQQEFLIKLGAQMAVPGIYLLSRIYDGTDSGETCATVGLSKEWVRTIFTANSQLYEILKNCNMLNAVPGINDLSPYKLGIIKSMFCYISQMKNDELMIFNIEPKGANYPSANLCLPGGGMKYQDKFDLENTAFREFKEEVGISLTHNDVDILGKIKFNWPDMTSLYFIVRIKNDYMLTVKNEISNKSNLQLPISDSEQLLNF